MAQPEETKKQKPFAEFLESTPPYTTETIADWTEMVQGTYAPRCTVTQPDIQLHCETEACRGVRFFHQQGTEVYLPDDDSKDCFLSYVCRNCRHSIKTYALILRRLGTSGAGQAMKYGEIPAFGPPTPARVITLIGPDRDMFLRGRRAENFGLGIGAFAYYRRVVENQKGHIIHEIAKASAKLGASPEMLAELAQAEKETQFSKAIDQVKTGIPAALMIDGHNPLTLLHTALSEGLHDHTDEECLEIAQEIRLVLTDLAERMMVSQP